MNEQYQNIEGSRLNDGKAQEAIRQAEVARLSYSDALRQVASSTKDLIQSEITLVTAELKATVDTAKNHITQSIVFSVLLALSILPFIAFLVIGLGELLDGRYWLSSLIVAVAFAVIGGSLAYRAYQKLKNVDIDFSHTREGVRRGVGKVKAKLEDIEQATKGESYA